MPSPNDTQSLDTFVWRPERSTVEGRQITVRLPLLGLDLLGITFLRFKASGTTNPEAAHLKEVQVLDQDAREALPLDGVIESSSTPRMDLPPHR